jgi:hypothetical protein
MSSVQGSNESPTVLEMIRAAARQHFRDTGSQASRVYIGPRVKKRLMSEPDSFHAFLVRFEETACDFIDGLAIYDVYDLDHLHVC